MPKDEEQPADLPALILPEGKDLLALFGEAGKIEGVLARIETDVRAETPDLTTKAGRDRVKSLAYKVSQSKTVLDKAGKGLNEDAQAQINKVNAERKLITTRLDALRDEVRKPVTEWDEVEDARKAAHADRVASLYSETLVQPNMSSAAIRDIMGAAENDDAYDWEEFKSVAEGTKEKALARWALDLNAAEEREAQEAELKRLQEEVEENRIRQAKEQAEREAQEAVRKAEAEARIQAESEKAEAEARAKQREADIAQAKAAAEDQAKREAAAAEERHVRELAEAKAREEQAAQRERDRLTRERDEEAEAKARREADEQHRSRILADINKAIQQIPHGEIGEALMAGKVPHVSVAI